MHGASAQCSCNAAKDGAWGAAELWDKANVGEVRPALVRGSANPREHTAVGLNPRVLPTLWGSPAGRQLSGFRLPGADHPVRTAYTLGFYC